MRTLLCCFLIGLIGAGIARADKGAEIYNQGVQALNEERYADAAQAFNQVLTGYPNTPNIDDVRMDYGYAALRAGDFANAVTGLAKLTAPTAKPDVRGTALFYTAQAQFANAQKQPDKKASAQLYSDASATLSTLIDFIPTAPASQGYLEDAYYFRGLAQLLRENYDGAEKDFLALIQKFPRSLRKPDYLYLLGGLYAEEANVAVAQKKTPEEVKAIAQKALDRFDEVARDPNALVQANEAYLNKAEVLFLLAQFDPTGAGYQTALDAYRKVKRKDDLIVVQKKRLEELRKTSQQALQQSGGQLGAAFATENSRLIQREQDRLKELENGTNPIIRALVRIAECYVSLRQPDEARTVLHRLVNSGVLPDSLKQEVDFQVLLSYALGGQIDKANQALDAYLKAHAGDPQADSISYTIATKLVERKDFPGALAEADRSLKDFPQGRFVAEVHSLKARVYKELNQLDKVSEELKLASQAGGPLAIQNQLTAAQTLAAQGDLKGALDIYKTVRDNNDAKELQSFGAAGYINTLQSLGRYDEVISDAKTFQTKFADSKSLPGVLLIAALALDKKGDPGAVAALQDVVTRFPKSDEAPYALAAVATVQLRSGDVARITQAVTDLRTKYPTAYPQILAASDALTTLLLKAKKFDDALALYQPLLNAPKPEVVVSAQNQIGAISLASAKAMGYYQSLPLDQRPEQEKRIAAAEQAYLAGIKVAGEHIGPLGEALDGLVSVLKQRRSFGLLTDDTMEAYLTKITSGVSDATLQAHIELTKAGLVFIYKNGASQYAKALDRFRAVVSANASLALTRQETSQYGELLLAAKDYPSAITNYQALLAHAENDPRALADAYYGLGATYLAQGDLAQMADNFTKMKAVPGGAAWHPRLQDANLGLALVAEQKGDPDGFAKQTYASLMQLPNIPVQARAMLGYGRLLQKAGKITPAADNSIEFAIHYFQEPHTLFDGAVPALSAEGLYDAGQAYEKAGDKANARQQYTDLLTNYGTTAPDWAAKAKEAAAKL